MALIRLSARKNAVHGVSPEGDFEDEAYRKRTRQGRTERYREPDEAGGGHPARAPGAGAMPGAELDDRGFPRPRSDAAHLMRKLTEPALADLGDQPAVMMVHGFLFDPHDKVSADPKDSNNPHARLYHFKDVPPASAIRHHTSSWPLGLGFGPDDESGAEGLALAYGWHSYPGIAMSLITHFQNFYARAYENAGAAAWNLLTLLHLWDGLLPAGKKIDLFCHSLGSRVVLRMIAHAAKHGRLDLLDRIDRVILLGGAEYVVEARLVLDRLSSVGMMGHISFYNVVSRENDVLDKLGENFGPRTFGNSNVIGHNGLDVEEPDPKATGWLDLQIDGRELQDWMKKKKRKDDEGKPIRVTGDNPNSVWDHWYYYTDPGNMNFYRAILRDREAWEIGALVDAGIPMKVSKKRSVFGT